MPVLPDAPQLAPYHRCNDALCGSKPQMKEWILRECARDPTLGPLADDHGFDDNRPPCSP